MIVIAMILGTAHAGDTLAVHLSEGTIYQVDVKSKTTDHSGTTYEFTQSTSMTARVHEDKWAFDNGAGTGRTKMGKGKWTDSTTAPVVASDDPSGWPDIHGYRQGCFSPVLLTVSEIPFPSTPISNGSRWSVTSNTSFVHPELSFVTSEAYCATPVETLGEMVATASKGSPQTVRCEVTQLTAKQVSVRCEATLELGNMTKVVVLEADLDRADDYAGERRLHVENSVKGSSGRQVDDLTMVVKRR